MLLIQRLVKATSFILCLIAIAHNGAAQADTPVPPKSREERMQQFLAKWSRPDGPGGSVAVVRDGKILYESGFGKANLEYDIPNSPTTVFHIASVSKQFTAFAIGLLAHQGKLSYNDDIRKYLPEMHDFGKTITIRHLLNHTSGLRDQWEMLAIAGWRLDDVITQEHIRRMAFREQELNFTPGSKFLYCNTGYSLLAEIVERVSHQPFPVFAQENIFRPLGMTHTRVHNDNSEIIPNRAYSYTASGTGYRLSALNYANEGATSVFTTVGDLAKWLDNLDTKRIGGAALIGEMETSGTLNNGRKTGYGFGLSVGRYRGLETVGHNGSDAGFRTDTLRFPAKRLSVIVLCNFAQATSSVYSKRIADIFLESEFPDPPGSASGTPAATRKPAGPGVSVSQDRLKAYAGIYRLAPGWLMNIRSEADGLTVQATGEERTPTRAESETRFFVPAYGSAIEFERNADSTVKGLLYRNIHAPRAAPFLGGTAALEEYAGTYYSPEADTYYTLHVREGKLIAEHPRNDSVTLTPSITDEFEGNRWYFSRISFQRDSQNRIIGFRLSGARIKNLRFDRIK